MPDKETKALEGLLKSWGRSQCGDIFDDLYEYSWGRLSGTKKEKIELHLKSCKKCRELLASYTDSRDRAKEAIPASASHLIHMLGTHLDLSRLLVKIQNLKGANLPAWLFTADATRSPSSETATFAVASNIIFLFEPTEDGFIVVFRHDSEGGVELVFPAESNDNNFIIAGGELSIDYIAKEPIGINSITAIMTTTNLFNSTELDFTDHLEIEKAVEKYVNALSSKHESQFHVSTLSFIVNH